MQQQFAKEIYRRLVSLRYDNLVSISKEPRWCTLSRGLKRGADLIHNTDIYLTLLILLCLCSNYTPSGISPGKIPSHPSHFAVLIADDLRVRTRVNVPLKGSESDGTAGGRWGGEGRGGGQRVDGAEGCSAPVGSGSLGDAPAQKLWTCQPRW